MTEPANQIAQKGRDRVGINAGPDQRLGVGGNELIHGITSVGWNPSNRKSRLSDFDVTSQCEVVILQVVDFPYPTQPQYQISKGYIGTDQRSHRSHFRVICDLDWPEVLNQGRVAHQVVRRIPA